MRSILAATLSALSLAGCTLPPGFETCLLIDPAQYGCGPRVPYCSTPCHYPGCGPYGAASNCGPPIYGYPPSGGLMWGQPAVAPAGDMGRIPGPQFAPPAAPPCAGNTANISPQGTGVQTVTPF